MKKQFEIFLETLAALIPIIFGYFAGILYISSYLNSFSISMHEIEMPIPIVLSYSFNIFSHNYFIYPFIVFLIISIILFLIKYNFYILTDVRRLMNITTFISIVIATAVLAVSLWINFVAKVAAHEKRDKIWLGETASIILRNTDTDYSFSFGGHQKALFTDCMERKAIKHIISTKEKTFSFCIFDESTGFLLIQNNETGNISPLRHVSKDE